MQSSTAATSLDNQYHHRVLQDLLKALQDDDLTDLTLRGSDDSLVLANRFLLGARSPVLKRMLYGSFQESRQTTVSLPYEQAVLEAVVEWCSSHEISAFRVSLGRNASSARRLVQLVQAADYLQLNELARLVTRLTHDLASRYPPLACVVYDQVASVDHSVVGQEALLLLQCRPYVALPPCPNTNGGIGQICAERLLHLYRNPHVQAGEWFLFQMLRRWVDAQTDPSHPQVVNVAKQCAAHLHLDWIEPQDLLGTVVRTKWIAMDKVTSAITQQALRASQERVWSLSCRGPANERILVEDAGHANANGIYYRIPGLANGQLYSKREVACGQQFVYTLSCKQNNSRRHIECRIFCSKLLTHQGVRRIMDLDDEDVDATQPQFRPLLQVIRSETVVTDAVPTYNEHTLSPDRRRKRKLQILLVSDGEHYMTATMAPKLRDSNRSKDIGQNSLIKLLAYEKYILQGKVALRIHKVSLISQDPGHQFGHPIDYYDDDHPESPPHTNVPGQALITEGSVESHIGQQLELDRRIASSASADLSDGDDNNSADPADDSLISLYSCHYSLDKAPVDSKIPRGGWRVECDGKAPTPSCRWIPASKSDANGNAKSDWEKVSAPPSSPKKQRKKIQGSLS